MEEPRMYTTTRRYDDERTDCPYCGHDPVKDGAGCEHFAGYGEGGATLAFKGCVPPRPERV